MNTRLIDLPPDKKRQGRPIRGTAGEFLSLTGTRTFTA
jgi:hypothetical protein